MNRTLCLWCPDWPVVSLRRVERVPATGPVVVMGEGGRVKAASLEARAEGVRRGLRRREAQASCPGAVVVDADPGLEARTFEEVARALDAVTARLAVDRPGLLSFPTRGPVRFFGDESEVARRALAAVDGARVGVAGSRLAAFLAARRTTAGEPVLLLDDEGSAGFLATRHIGVLRERGLGELAGLLRRLGVRTLGDLAALPEPAVAARFGPDGLLARRLARGLDDDPGALVTPSPELAETAELDPPAQRIDVAAFAARALASRLLDRLAQRGLALTRVTVEAETEHGERLARVWRFAGPFTDAALAQRVRWQLEAWVGGEDDEADTTTGGLILLRLVPDEVVPARGHQLDFFGVDALAGERAARVLARLQGMLGHEAVVQPVLRGGRTPRERTGWSPFGDPPPASWPLAEHLVHSERPRTKEGPAPWPGAVPPPAPALVYDPPLPAALVDADGTPVHISGRGELAAPPAHLRGDGVVDGPVEGWAGPWPHDVRFWDPCTRRRRALFQVVAGDVACLVSVSDGQASVEALYD